MENMIGGLVGTHRAIIGEDGKTYWTSAEAWWAEQQELWENRQLCKGVSENGL